MIFIYWLKFRHLLHNSFPRVYYVCVLSYYCSMELASLQNDVFKLSSNYLRDRFNTVRTWKSVHFTIEIGLCRDILILR
jgi:hypothetical protein